MTTRGLILLLVALGALLVAGCESSQDKAKKIAKQGQAAFTAKGHVVKTENPDVKIVGTGVLTSKEGAAAVVLLRNTSKTGQVDVPISIDVKGAGGKSVFRNDEPGLAKSLTAAAIVPAGREVVWVHDQVYPTGKPVSVEAKVGPGKGKLTRAIPRIEVTTPEFHVDPVSGVEGSGKVINRSKLEQKEFVISAVALRGNKVVAAGRAQIERLKVGTKKVPYNVFFIGEPRGSRILIEAPPTNLGS